MYMCMCYTVAQCMNVLNDICKVSCISKKSTRKRKGMCVVLNDNRLCISGQPSNRLSVYPGQPSNRPSVHSGQPSNRLSVYRIGLLTD